MNPPPEYLYGVRGTDVDACQAERVLHPSLRLRVEPEPGARVPLSKGIYFRMQDVAPIKIDPQSPSTLAEGLCGRLARELPRADETLLSRFRTWALEDMNTRVVPLPADQDLSVPAWLERTNYTAEEKQEFLDLAKELDAYTQTHVKLKVFGKDEFLAAFKYLRLIAGREKAVPVILGPAMKAIEDHVYSDPSFIKKVPIYDRPAYMLTMCSAEREDFGFPGVVEGDDALFYHNGKWYETDYSSYECHFRDVQKELELESYRLFLINHPLLFILLKWLCYSGHWYDVRNRMQAYMAANRNSGDQQTSCGNGEANLRIQRFMKIVCAGREITEGDYASIGVMCKLDAHDSIGDASFCGMTFDMDEVQMVRDPRPVLTKFSWSPLRYVRSSDVVFKQLLRLKGISLLYEMGSCPILFALAKAALRVSRGATIRRSLVENMSLYERERLYEALRNPPPAEPTEGTRRFFERRFGISVAQQRYIERVLDQSDGLGFITTFLDFDDDWYTSRQVYVSESPDGPDSWPAVRPPILTIWRGQGVGKPLSRFSVLPAQFSKTVTPSKIQC